MAVEQPGPPRRVPEGFSLTVHAVPTEPGVEVRPSGLILAHFGSGSDDPHELVQTIQQARAAARNNPDASLRFATDVRLTHELLTERPPSTITATRTIIWTCHDDALRIVLDGDRLEAGLVAELADLPSLGLVVDSGWAAGSRLFRALRAEGVPVRATSEDTRYLIEVARPDGTWVLSWTVGDAPELEARPQVAPVWSAPRLRRVLLDALASDSHAELHRELAQRTIPLVFMVRPDGSPIMRSFPNVDCAVLPVFADIQSLHRTAAEIGLANGRYGYGALAFSKLVEWTRAQAFMAAVGFFNDEGAVFYVPLTR